MKGCNDFLWMRKLLLTSGWIYFAHVQFCFCSVFVLLPTPVSSLPLVFLTSSCLVSSVGPIFIIFKWAALCSTCCISFHMFPLLHSLVCFWSCASSMHLFPGYISPCKCSEVDNISWIIVIIFKWTLTLFSPHALFPSWISSCKWGKDDDLSCVLFACPWSYTSVSH